MIYKPKTRDELKELVDNLTISLGDIDTSLITDMFAVFHDSDRNDFSGIESWDTSNVKNMDSILFNVKQFNHDISSWNVSNVTDMSFMFSGATSFNQDISKWDVSKVESMCYMFSNATNFNQDISSWDVSNVKIMDYMFDHAANFNQDISVWDVSNVESMNGMFCGAYKFNQDISAWDVSNVIYIKEIFCFAESMNQDISNWNLESVDIENLSDTYEDIMDHSGYSNPDVKTPEWIHTISKEYDTLYPYCDYDTVLEYRKMKKTNKTCQALYNEAVKILTNKMDYLNIQNATRKLNIVSCLLSNPQEV